MNSCAGGWIWDENCGVELKTPTRQGVTSGACDVSTVYDDDGEDERGWADEGSVVCHEDMALDALDAGTWVVVPEVEAVGSTAKFFSLKPRLGPPPGPPPEAAAGVSLAVLSDQTVPIVKSVDEDSSAIARGSSSTTMSGTSSRLSLIRSAVALWVQISS